MINRLLNDLTKATSIYCNTTHLMRFDSKCWPLDFNKDLKINVKVSQILRKIFSPPLKKHCSWCRKTICISGNYSDLVD